MPNPILKIENITKQYATHKAVDNVSLTLNAGECLALLGHNGAGKTSLIKLALGLTIPTSGKITLLGREGGILSHQDLHKYIGYLPENISFYDQMTAKEILTYYAKLKGDSLHRVDELLETVGLGEFKNRRLKAYSKGMRQRLGIAQALLGEPKLLFLDEPTTGLDPIGREEVFKLIQELRDKGTAIIFSSHILRELESKVDQVAIMGSGKIIVEDFLDNLRLKTPLPAHVTLKCNGSKDKWEEQITKFMGNEKIEFKHTRDMIEFPIATSKKKDLLKFIANSKLHFDDFNITPASLADIYSHICDEAKEKVTKELRRE